MLKRLEGVPAEAVDDALRTIGKVIVAANEIDVSSTALLGALLTIGDGPWPRETVLHVISFAQKLAILRSILKLHRTPFTQGLLSKITRAETLMRTRDVVAHGMLFYERSEFIVAQLGLPKILARRARSEGALRVNSLEPLADEMLGLADFFVERLRQIEASRLEPPPA